ncbi:MAG: GOLPH3/VPS74 family protein [Syntrophobacteraceae bacterium]
MLSFAEEILLLSLDAQGSIRQLSSVSLDYALAGAALTDLAFLDRIDTDLEALFVVDATPTGDTFLDAILAQIQSGGNQFGAMRWLDHFAKQAAWLQQEVLDRLIQKQILKKENRKVLWVFAVNRYPIIDNREPRAVTARLRELILSDDIPDPHDAVLISLVNSCGLFGEILTKVELESARGRIEQLAKLDLVGRQIALAISTIEKALFMASIPTV